MNQDPNSQEFHDDLAYRIYLRWNKDAGAAHIAWKRLFQNNCSFRSFNEMLERYIVKEIKNKIR
jgi:hypothetical protein